ncbi:MAG: DNA polymerase III [Treponema sp.]|nr:DNA polymerase III [Treponema sp.]MCL2236811.1 DNA polymerase III [Treponema sp.]
MFENIIDQGAVLQLRDDIQSGRNAPSMLFYGPGETGKGSASLELARVLSCEEPQPNLRGSWKCACASCEQHRFLRHDDLLAIGNRSFAAEIAACNKTLLKNTENQNVKLLFYRSIRKLMLRFSPVLMEDDPKLAKSAQLLQSVDEGLNDFLSNTSSMEKAAYEKNLNSLVKNALALENDGIASAVPIAQIRKASYWCRLAPNGKRKTLIIENAESMRDEARNSLLKLLEEPPPSVCIVLTAKRREVIMPTILSRLRPYRFLKRSEQSEKDVIRRVFQDEGNNLSEYMDSFLPQSTEKLYPLAAWFIVSLARICVMSAKKKGIERIPEILNALGERYAPIAEKSGYEKSLKTAAIIKTIATGSNNFEDSSFSRFMKICLDLIGDVTRNKNECQITAYNDMFRKNINEAVTAVDVLNINSAIALESLVYNLKRGFNG